MLQSIRDKSSGWFSWLIIGIIVIVFALFGVSRYIGGSANTNTVATVNGQPISTIQVQSMYYQLQNIARQKGFYSATQSFADLLKKQALQDVIQTQVLLQAATNSGFLLSPVVVQAAIEAVPDFQVNSQFSYQKWQNFVTNSPNADSFIQSVKNEQLLSQVQSGFVTTAFVTPDELKQFQVYVDQERHLGFFTVPLSLFATSMPVSLADQKKYYLSHTADFAMPETVKIAYIELSLQSLMDNIKPSDQQLQAYYQDNLSQYQVPAKWQLKRMIVPLADDSKKKFSKQALALSEQASQTKTFWVSANDIGPDLQKVVDSLTRVGQVSLPVQTSDGYVAYALLAKKPEQQLSFNQVKNRLLTAYKQQQAQSRFDNDADQLANLTFSQPNTLEPAAKALGLTVKTSEYVSRQGGKDAVTKDPNVIQVAFSHDVLTNRNNSQVINLGDNSQIVLRVVDEKPASTKPFKDVQAQIQTILATQWQQQQAKQLSDKLSQAISKGGLPAALATQYKLNYTDLGFVSRRTKQDPAIIDAGFAMPAEQKTMVFPSNSQYYVLVLSGIRKGSAKYDSQEAQQLSRAVGYAEGQLAYQLYQASVTQHAKIKILNS